MASPIAVLDACVLYPAPIRDLLMQLAKQDAFQARWSDDIHAEWITSLLADRDDLTPNQLARTRALMDQHVPDALVTGHVDLLPSLTLPDPNDRHVLAAAIVGGATVIVTFNLKDFPAGELAPYECRAVHPDDFLLEIADRAPDQMLEAARDRGQAAQSARELSRLSRCGWAARDGTCPGGPGFNSHDVTGPDDGGTWSWL